MKKTNERIEPKMKEIKLLVSRKYSFIIKTPFFNTQSWNGPVIELQDGNNGKAIERKELQIRKRDRKRGENGVMEMRLRKIIPWVAVALSVSALVISILK